MCVLDILYTLKVIILYFVHLGMLVNCGSSVLHLKHQGMLCELACLQIFVHHRMLCVFGNLALCTPVECYNCTVFSIWGCLFKFCSVDIV